MKSHYDVEMLMREIGWALGGYTFKTEAVPGTLFPYFGSVCYGPQFAEEVGGTRSDIERAVNYFLEYWLSDNDSNNHSPGQIYRTIFNLGAALERRKEEYVKVARGERVFEVEIGFTRCVLQFGRLGNTLGLNIRHQEIDKPVPKTALGVLDKFVNNSLTVVTPYVEAFIFKMDFSVFKFLPSLKDKDQICSKSLDELISILSDNWGHVSYAEDKDKIFYDLVNQYHDQDLPKAIIGDCRGFPISMHLIHSENNVNRDDKIWREGNLSMSEKGGEIFYSFRYFKDLCLQFEIHAGLDMRDKVSNADVSKMQNRFKKQASLLHVGLLSMCKIRSLEEYDSMNS